MGLQGAHGTFEALSTSGGPIIDSRHRQWRAAGSTAAASWPARASSAATSSVLVLSSLSRAMYTSGTGPTGPGWCSTAARSRRRSLSLTVQPSMPIRLQRLDRCGAQFDFGRDARFAHDIDVALGELPEPASLRPLGPPHGRDVGDFEGHRKVVQVVGDEAGEGDGQVEAQAHVG